MSWRRFFRRARWDEERRRELETYLEHEIDENIARGLPPDRAKAAAIRKLGNPTLIREEIYHMNSIGWFESWWQDVKYGVRVLRRSPAFTTVAVLSLMLGVGANTAIFELIDALRLRTLPVSRPETLVEVRLDDHGTGRTGGFNGRYPRMTNPLWEHLRGAQGTFPQIFAWGTATFDRADGGEAQPVQGIWVSGDFFAALDVLPAAGRLISAGDDVRGCPTPGVVLSYRYWQRQYDGDASVVGRTIHLEGAALPIVGISGAGFFGLEVGRSFDVAVPICAEPLLTARSRLDKEDRWWLSVMGRLPEGLTVDEASSQVRALSAAVLPPTVSAQYSSKDRAAYLAFTLKAVPAGSGVSELRSEYEQPLWLLLGIAGAVLVIACGNLANLIIARASAREREIAVRLAIGASRRRVLRQLLVESLLVAVAGTALGTLLASTLGSALVGLIETATQSDYVDLHLSWRVLGFAGALAVLTCVLFGVMPAFRATRTDPGLAMKTGARGTSESRGRVGLRRILVVGQVALSLVLVTLALLFVGTLRNLLTTDVGMRTADVLDVEIDLRRAGVSADRQPAFQLALFDKIAAVPGVEVAAVADIVPLSGSGWNENLVIDGVPRKPYPDVNRVSQKYFETLGIPFSGGRLFDARDTVASTPVAIVNEAFGRAYFNTPLPLNHEFHFEAAPNQTPTTYRVIGVVKDSKYRGLRQAFGPLIYLAASQETDLVPSMSVLLRSRATTGLVPALTAIARDIDPRISLSVSTLDSQILALLVRERLMATLSGFFGLLAGLLAAIGLYGVMSYLVARRTFEIGLRMALGADGPRVLRLVLRESVVLVATGIAIGTGLAVVSTKWSATLLFGLEPGDPRLVAIAAIALALVGTAASLLPARRASRLSPTIALRAE